jgi:hypothetical protein
MLIPAPPQKMQGKFTKNKHVTFTLLLTKHHNCRVPPPGESPAYYRYRDVLLQSSASQISSANNIKQKANNPCTENLVQIYQDCQGAQREATMNEL